MVSETNKAIKWSVVCFWILIFTDFVSAQELAITEKICACGEHFEYYGQWGWCDCEQIDCDVSGNCICVKPCEENK